MKDTVEERKAEDRERVKQILGGINGPHQPREVRRLGAPPPRKEEQKQGNLNRPRPVRLSFGSEAERDDTLKAFRLATRDAENALEKRVSMRRDMTPQEREEDKLLFLELKHRRERARADGDDQAVWIRRRGAVVNKSQLNTGKQQRTELYPSKSVSVQKDRDLLILGDFNYPDIDWKVDRACTGPNNPAAVFLETVKDSYLLQHQTEPIRFRQGQKANLIDLVLSNRENMVDDIQTVSGLGKSDHFSLVISLNLQPIKEKERVFLSYSKTDPSILKEKLSQANWEEELEGKDVEGCWAVMKETIQVAVDKAVPKGVSRRFHPEKCHVLKLGSKKSEAKYTMKGTKDGKSYTVQLQESEVERDLGVFVGSSLNFGEHVARVTSKANQVVGVIRRNFDFLDENLFVQLYKSL
ncbi:hypothetical protein HAZT_HAZT008581 [Hyalella azteca]|uniref:Endonuclease/exonuclease/phosphatase domain-containing protein n=1 Tax=Hyalella azteca TaxID=294128 RepID=A0A6A0HCD0_HYAAZ|nr:hypothetical protein HAZT_HAZT008581 [Hyalella azteca]